jgi:hypothetical protein
VKSFQEPRAAESRCHHWYAERAAPSSATESDPKAPVVNDSYLATNQERGVLPEDLLMGEGGGQIAVGVGLGE